MYNDYVLIKRFVSVRYMYVLWIHFMKMATNILSHIPHFSRPRFPLSHVLSRSILQTSWGRLVQRPIGWLFVHAALWSRLPDVMCSIRQCPIPRKFLDIHDGICMGQTKLVHTNDLHGIVCLYCTILTVGVVGIQCAHRKQSGGWLARYGSWACVLLFTGCVSANDGTHTESSSTDTDI